jgi:hypothetical protein
MPILIRHPHRPRKRFIDHPHLVRIHACTNLNL